MGDWWQRNIVEPGKLPLLLALTAFVLTFVITRGITRLIRAGKGPFGNVSSGGLHIHHVVPGVVLTVIGGFGAVASARHGFGSAAFAIVFGIGAGLVLDEFALVLHLDDVYWTEAGRKSVEVVVLTAALVGLMLVGFSPFGVNDLSEDELEDRGTVISTVAVNFLFALAVLSKGKARMAIFSVIVPFVGLIGLVRLARPGSWWARRFYRRRPRARAKAVLRAYRHDRRWAGPGRALGNWLGGKPDAELTRAADHR
ncbi:hypothetical protein [Streptomyces aurantiogriseus]|uniref:Integral membrane protein n=1 Tax=Streptomyces aurantiogriseus TaxID=66870 RepID=A0A918CES2_9ACTN|nr:hypothetical protein [Streptomyces aurantiogriseus]GGR20461.1 hypothetical protein GCM10010251_40330 [Streptomyces aurantiogriseus]